MIALKLLSWQLCHYIDYSQHQYHNGGEQHSKNYYSHCINKIFVVALLLYILFFISVPIKNKCL